MSAGKSPAAIPLARDNNEDRRSLARIAARMLAVAELEDQALEEIDRIASGIERAVRIEYLLLAVSFGIFAAFTLTGLLVWIVAGLTGTDLGWRPMIILVPMIVLAAAPVLTWRVRQYGLGPVHAKRPALYPIGATASVDTLEKLFEHLGRRSGPRAYFRTRSGEKRYLSHRIFWGRLRGLLLSDNASDCAMVLPPLGFRLGGDIFIEAEPEEIIAALKPKRRAGPGREPKYAYTDSLINLIDNPALDEIDLTDETKARRQVEAMLVTWFQDHADTSGDSPRADMVRPYAEKIAKRLWITRGGRADFSPEA
ncbi:hypothetical protein [Novosphingobium humi]|uniref:Uncharacterized protein n=1 Tax=Novosphingobium humi TaxID=2282397 RepID=A0ABY7TWU9_9SPHN|nr:hypothetical protein [Novosphingobium humi]WCT77747.1 hypothetical protein PQ457_01855 [Novosphingobium humi]